MLRIISRVVQEQHVSIRNKFTYSGLTSTDFMKKPLNEPVLTYKKCSKERIELEKALKELSGTVTDVPLLIGSKELKGKLDQTQIMPSDKNTVIARYSYATPENINEAIELALSVREKWALKSLRERAEIFLEAADLCAGKYRMKLNASTMLGQGKTIVQAEIDAACELIDFLRFNAYFALDLEKYIPISTNISKNEMIYRPMEGFVASIAPFNFTAIGGNLASAPALAGNVVIFKPSNTAVLSNYFIMKAFEEAGLPKGVISFLPSDGPIFGNTVTDHSHLAAINFTGSVPTFVHLWKQVGEKLGKGKYITFPKLVGECGGKNFHFVHPSADLQSVVTGTILSAFEYSGQKCSACSRLYLPKSLWSQFQVEFGKVLKELKVGDVREGDSFTSSVIDKIAFDRIKRYIDLAKSNEDGSEIVFGGGYDDSKGFFIQPTLVKVTSPKSKIFREEIFGPVVSVYIYPDNEVDTVLGNVKNDTPYGLTGAVFSKDEVFLKKAAIVLRDAVGNLYLNDKSTGSIVGQQPFGGARMSGTNDKAGGPHYFLKWTSPQTIKTTSVPLTSWKYPSME
uniref:Multifunctional fusion protein n=1 Tax=Strongyloides papillosus TaxID=174720 RepID=A0A0N5C9F5_STREA